MIDNECELIRQCLDTKEYLTVKTSQRYVLFHQNILRNQSDLESPSDKLQKLFSSNYLSILDAQIISHIHSLAYDLIVFPDQSIVYTQKILPYYVENDLKLLEQIGMSKDEIELFINKLDAQEEFPLKNYDQLVQKIFDYTDISTRLKCRQVCKKWKELVDNSSQWIYVKLPANCRWIKRALTYFQYVDIRELDLTEIKCKKIALNTSFHLYSLRTLSISINHPLEFFTYLFQIAPFLQYIKLIQIYSSLTTKNQLYNSIHFIINQCRDKLKCLRCLHIQLLSQADQIYLQSSFDTSIPISYEILNS